MPKADMEMDLVVNFGRRCCYNQDFTGPARFIVDFGVNYPTGKIIYIRFDSYMKYESYQSRYTDVKCVFGSKFNDLYIDRKCQVSTSGIYIYIPKNMTLLKGNRIPISLMYMGEKIGVVGKRSFPLDRLTVTYPYNYSGYAGTFTIYSQ